jgi:hypothetical protein
MCGLNGKIKAAAEQRLALITILVQASARSRRTKSSSVTIVQDPK